MAADQGDLRVWVDQELCTGDGLCVQYAPDVFEFDVDGLAYVKNDEGALQSAPGSTVAVPARLRLDVLDAAHDCPGECIHVVGVADDVAPTSSDHGAADHGSHKLGERVKPGNLPSPAVVECLAEP